MVVFIEMNWQWVVSTIIGSIGVILGSFGVLLSYKAYKYSMQANKDTNELIKNQLAFAIETQNKEEIRNRLVETGLSEFRLKGTPIPFLKNEYGRLQEKGWTEEDFEKIFETIFIRHKGKKPKRSFAEYK